MYSYYVIHPKSIGKSNHVIDKNNYLDLRRHRSRISSQNLCISRRGAISLLPLLLSSKVLSRTVFQVKYRLATQLVRKLGFYLHIQQSHR